jgi:glutamine cyclotransferase
MGRLVRASLVLMSALVATAFVFSCAPSPQENGEAPGTTTLPAATASPHRPVLEASPASATGTVSGISYPTPGSEADSPAAAPIPTYSYHVLKVYPHDRNAFTQGLVIHDGILYEGTGLWGCSTLRRVELETGQVVQSYALPESYFGEGVTAYGDVLLQLTWKSRIGFVYDRAGFEQLRTFSYPTEGWGITHDGQRLIMSDGSSTLFFLDPESFQEIGRVEVRDGEVPVTRLNELEYVRGEVYANVWQTDLVARIDPQSGQVTAWVDLSGLLAPEDRDPAVDVLNGIAYDEETDRLFVTGKLWPKLFEIDLVAPE